MALHTSVVCKMLLTSSRRSRNSYRPNYVENTRKPAKAAKELSEIIGRKFVCGLLSWWLQ